jgi:hypothetical protein
MFLDLLITERQLEMTERYTITEFLINSNEWYIKGFLILY